MYHCKLGLRKIRTKSYLLSLEGGGYQDHICRTITKLLFLCVSPVGKIFPDNAIIRLKGRTKVVMRSNSLFIQIG